MISQAVLQISVKHISTTLILNLLWRQFTVKAVIVSHNVAANKFCWLMKEWHKNDEEMCSISVTFIVCLLYFITCDPKVSILNFQLEISGLSVNYQSRFIKSFLLSWITLTVFLLRARTSLCILWKGYADTHTSWGYPTNAPSFRWLEDYLGYTVKCVFPELDGTELKEDAFENITTVMSLSDVNCICELYIP